MSVMGKEEHPSQLKGERAPLVRACEHIDDHEPHFYHTDDVMAGWLPANRICGGLPVKVISINDAKSRRIYANATSQATD
jgi:hypothetical protein